MSYVARFPSTQLDGGPRIPHVPREEAIRFVSQEGMSFTQVAQDLGIDAGMFR